MVLYTGAARQEAGDDTVGDDEDMNLWISLHEDWTNNSYLQSNVAQQIEVVHSERVLYQESGSVSTDRWR